MQKLYLHFASVQVYDSDSVVFKCFSRHVARFIQLRVTVAECCVGAESEAGRLAVLRVPAPLDPVACWDKGVSQDPFAFAAVSAVVARIRTNDSVWN